MQSFLVDTQLLQVSSGSSIGVSTHQEDVGKRPALRHVEALEVSTADVQIVLLLLKVAIVVGIAQVILQHIGLTCHLTFRVKLEHIQVGVIPVIALILETDGIVCCIHLPYLK